MVWGLAGIRPTRHGEDRTGFAKPGQGRAEQLLHFRSPIPIPFPFPIPFPIMPNNRERERKRKLPAFPIPSRMMVFSIANKSSLHGFEWWVGLTFWLRHFVVFCSSIHAYLSTREEGTPMRLSRLVLPVRVVCSWS